MHNEQRYEYFGCRSGNNLSLYLCLLVSPCEEKTFSSDSERERERERRCLVFASQSLNFQRRKSMLATRDKDRIDLRSDELKTLREHCSGSTPSNQKDTSSKWKTIRAKSALRRRFVVSFLFCTHDTWTEVQLESCGIEAKPRRTTLSESPSLSFSRA